ncbi:MAG: dihydrolipoyl dehydrogenase [Acidobacteriota bacterium]|jgi:dihydrolipoamide dehydrogenase|nr:dihydrolipoyl dehydrogenase [Acidobacteriota bacterium]
MEIDGGGGINYDVIIIGAGPGGYSAALKAAKNGLKTLLIEKAKLGGVCLNEGCIPTKTLLYSAKIFDNAKNGAKYGVTVENIALDHGKVVKRKDKTVKILAAGLKSSLQNNGVNYLNDEARLVKGEAGNAGVLAGGEVLAAKHIIIASGSSAIMPPIEGAAEMYSAGMVLTNREILDIGEPPKSLAVIGGGVVGLELASYFNSAGSVVTVIEMLPQIGGGLDGELAEILLKDLQKKGISFILNARVVRIAEGSVIYEQAGETRELCCEKALMSVGRSANVSGLGLAEAGVEFSSKGIVTNEFCETNAAGIYAIGDVNGRLMLAHAAYREADVCVNRILGIDDAVDYTNIPAVIYTNPETAAVGETEESAKEKGCDYEAVKVSMRYSGRYLAENEGGDGICKIILDRNSREIIGVHMIANYSSEIIYGAGILIRNKTKVGDIEKIVFPHPSVGEIIREALI